MDRGEVESLVEVAFAGGAIAEEDHGDLVGAVFLVLELKGPRPAGGVQALGADLHANRADKVLVRVDLVAPLIPHPVQQHVVHGQAVLEQGSVLPVAGEDVVVALLQGSGGPEGHRLLPLVLREGAHAAGPLELEGRLVQLAGHDHLAVHLHETLIGEHIANIRRQALVEPAVLVHDLEILHLRLVHRLQTHMTLRLVVGGGWHGRLGGLGTAVPAAAGASAGAAGALGLSGTLLLALTAHRWRLAKRGESAPGPMLVFAILTGNTNFTACPRPLPSSRPRHGHPRSGRRGAGERRRDGRRCGWPRPRSAGRKGRGWPRR